MVEAFKRVFGATIFFGTEEQSAAKTLTDWTRFHFLDRMQLWYSANGCSIGQSESNENVITLSEAFYSEIDRHRIPVEQEVVSSLAHAPGILDFYLWLAWKSWTVNGVPSRIPIVGPAGLCDQLGAVQYSSPRRFRHLIGVVFELANFDDNQGHVIGKRAVPPGGRTLEDCVFHFRKRSRG